MTRTITLPATDGNPWRIYALSDCHIGSVLCDEISLERWITSIAQDEHGRVVITGDLIAAIGKGDKRLDWSGLASWVREGDPQFTEDVLDLEIQRTIELLQPIADRIDGYVEGNHERMPRRWYGRAVGPAIMRDLGCRDAYLGAQGWLCYSFKVTATQRRRLSMYLHHGYSAGRTIGGQAIMLERMLRDNDADIAICGHSHETFVRPLPRVRLDAKTGKLIEQMRWGILAGTWEHSSDENSDGWGDEHALSPKRIGGAIIEYDPSVGTSRVLLTA